MAEEKINRGRPAPSFVNAPRVERSYTGPADPIVVWADAKSRMEQGGGPVDRIRTLREYNRLCQLARVESLACATEYGPATGSEEVVDVVLGSIGRTALGDSAAEVA